MSGHVEDPHEKFYKTFRGDPKIASVLSGPFYGMDFLFPDRAEAVDRELRRAGCLSMVYAKTYVIASSGPDGVTEGSVEATFKAILARDRRRKHIRGRRVAPVVLAALTIYKAERQSECMEAIFGAEGLALPEGYESWKRHDPPVAGPVEDE